MREEGAKAKKISNLKFEISEKAKAIEERKLPGALALLCSRYAPRGSVYCRSLSSNPLKDRLSSDQLAEQ